MKVLLVEDNTSLAQNITEYFESRGHAIDWRSDGITGLAEASQGHFDVIVLDVMLPGMDGYQLCRQLRQQAEKDTPLIMLTARDTEQDKLQGFEEGADDYLVKPFSLFELEARLHALVRRSQNSFKSKTLVVADLEYDPNVMSLKRGGKSLTLKPVPRKILIYLMKNTHRVVTREEIEREVWQDDVPDREVLRVHIHAIRSTIDRNAEIPLLSTIHGVGYRLAETEE